MTTDPDWYGLIRETWDRVDDGPPAFVSFFRSRARRRYRQLNEGRDLPTYRYEVVRQGRRWAVVAFQNLAPEASRGSEN